MVVGSEKSISNQNIIYTMMNTQFSNEEISAHLSKKSTIVSVGSGMGVLEQYLITQGYKVICIDPTENHKDPYTRVTMTRLPDYKSVKAYLEDDETKNPIGDDIHLLLNYPLPDYALYDIASIYDLKPRFVTIVAGYFGHSGSLLLQIWLRRNGVDTAGKLSTEASWEHSLGINWNSVVKQKYVKLKYQLKFPKLRFTGLKTQNFITTLMRTDKALDDGEQNQLYTPTIEETVAIAKKNVSMSLERCLRFISHRLTDSQLTDDLIQLMLNTLFRI